MSEVTVNGKLQVRRDTTENWNNVPNCIPLEGEVIVYTDYIDRGEDAYPRYIPGIKVGTGNAYVQDLPFLEEDLRDRVMEHVTNMELHVTDEDRTFWNNKLNWSGTIVDGLLVLDRN